MRLSIFIAHFKFGTKTKSNSKMESHLKSPGTYQRTVESAEDLVSVTVRKESPCQKAGISLVERQNAVYVTKIADHGLFYETEVSVGDKVLSINGKRLKPGEGARHIIRHISNAKATVTMVVKKAGITPSRGSRGGKIKRKPQRIFKNDLHRNKDGSLNAELDPRNLPTDNDDKDQIPIKGYKLFESQPVGVSLVDHDNMIFVTAISSDSIFRDTALQVGDRVVAVNGMSFMAYADAGLALKNGEKSPKEVVLTVEKGHINVPALAKQNIRENDHCESPIKENLIYDEEELCDDFLKMTPKKNFNASYSSKGGSPWKTPTRSESDSEGSLTEGGFDLMARVLGRQANGDDCANNKSSLKNVNYESSLKNVNYGSITDDSYSTSMSNSFSSTPFNKSKNMSSKSLTAKMNPDDFDHEYIRIKVEKDSEEDTGIKFKKTEGKFILTALPQHEKRINLGVHVLAVNGDMNINTVAKAEDLMSRNKGYVTLMVDFSSPVELHRTCPCCGDPIFANGEHISGRRGHGRVKVDDEMSVFSTESSIYTAQAGNRGGSGLQRTSIPSIPEVNGKNKHVHTIGNRYNVEDYESDNDDSDESEEEAASKSRSPTSKRYQSGEKFMIRVAKTGKYGDKDPGISLFDYKGSIYVGDIVHRGPFFATSINVGDKVLSVNGRKASMIKSASNAMDLIEEHDAVSLFLLRPDRIEYKEAMKKSRQLNI